MQKIIKSIILISLLALLVHCQFPSRTKDENKASPVILTAALRKNLEGVEASGKKYAVATQGIYATQAAKKILNEGGNAIDAALAASFTLAVERPHSTGIGGGGFMLFREGKSKKIFAIDFRERAPLAARKEMFLGPDGLPISTLSINGVLASAVPGLVAGLLEIHQRFGHLSREKILRPAIDLAEKGFPIYPNLARALTQKESVLALDPEASAIFLDKNKKALPEGHILQQKDLSKTLKRIARYGKKGFYQGPVAHEYVFLFKKNNGLITQSDLNSYEVKWRRPVSSSYKGHSLFSMPPPSSGGIHIIQFLNMLEDDSLKNIGFLETKSIHLAATAFQSAFADRAQYLGDDDFVHVPTKELLSKNYAKKRRSEFDLNHARKSETVKAGSLLGEEHTETTHLSIMDQDGNVVSTTQTINGYMGASVVVPHTGIVLNNEMDDFSARPGASNLFGAIGSDSNSIAPRKTPLSSMGPTIVMKGEEPIMSIGAPGGTRIITCVAQTILNYLEFKLPLYESIASIRYHHQWQPDQLDIDPPGPKKDTLEELKKMGHNVQLRPIPCNVMAVTHEGDIFHAVSDPRDIGTSTAL